MSSSPSDGVQPADDLRPSEPYEVNLAEPSGRAKLDALLGKAENYPELKSLDPFSKSLLDDAKQDRELRAKYAIYFIWILIGQLLVLNALFVGVGAQWLNYSDWLFHAFLGGTFIEVIGIIYLIVAYLFPTRAISTPEKPDPRAKDVAPPQD